MKIINGALGEGGGQILRTSLSLAMCLGAAIRINNIRAGRKKPGLLRQHLACIKASQQICNAQVKGAELGSKSIEFIPGKIQAGEYRVAIGSAGSTSLVFQTVLPALLQADAVSELYLEGGTHNQSAPSYEFISNAFIPVLKKMGIKVDLELLRYGFYPNGGGSWRARIWPSQNLKALNLLKRGDILQKRASAIYAGLPQHIAQRELNHVQKKCGWHSRELSSKEVTAFGPGNMLSLYITSQNLTEVFDTPGKLGVKAERVAGSAVKTYRRYLNSGAAVGEYLCDQLLLPMTLAKGGCFSTLKPSLHSNTNIAVIEQFSDCNINVKQQNEDLYVINL